MKPTRHGFSLLELVAAMGLIALGAALSIKFTSVYRGLSDHVEAQRRRNEIRKVIRAGLNCSRTYQQAGITRANMATQCTSTSAAGGQGVGPFLPLFRCRGARLSETGECDPTLVQTLGKSFDAVAGTQDFGSHLVRTTCSTTEGGLVIRAVALPDDQREWDQEENLIFGGRGGTYVLCHLDKLS